MQETLRRLNEKAALQHTQKKADEDARTAAIHAAADAKLAAFKLAAEVLATVMAYQLMCFCVVIVP
jgi:nucleoside permease NupC